VRGRGSVLVRLLAELVSGRSATVLGMAGRDGAMCLRGVELGRWLLCRKEALNPRRDGC